MNAFHLLLSGHDTIECAYFRKLLLDELGKNGYEKELEEALQHTERKETGRHIHAGKEVPK